MCVCLCLCVNSAYDDILAMSATLCDPAVSQLPVPLGSNTEGYEVMNSTPLSLTVRDEVSLFNCATQQGHAQSISASFRYDQNAAKLEMTHNAEYIWA